MVLQGGAKVISEPNGTWSFPVGQIEPYSGSSGGTFQNQGTLSVTGTDSIGVALVNSGKINVTSGSLSVGGTLTQSGLVSIAAGTTLTTSGAYTQSSGTTNSRVAARSR